MAHKNRTNLKKYIFAAAVILLLALIIIPQAGSFLVLDHQLEKPGALVILMGDVPVRSLEAVDLYRAGYAEEIILVQSHQAGIELLQEQGITLAGQAEQTEMVLKELDVPEEAIIFLPGAAQSTFDEAKILAEYLEERTDLEALILVTSSFHTRRTYIIFNRALSDLDREVILYSRASRYDDFQPEHWWQCRESAKMVVLEYLKLAYFLAWEQWQ